MFDFDILLLRLAFGMLVEHRWRAELRRRAEFRRTGAHRRRLDAAARRLDHPVRQVRLEAVQTLRDLAGDFPELRPAVRGLLAARLDARSAAYRDRALPADLREMRRFLHEPGEGVVGPWRPS